MEIEVCYTSSQKRERNFNVRAKKDIFLEYCREDAYPILLVGGCQTWNPHVATFHRVARSYP